ncbi:hypothetical protein ACMBCM_07335, partial [Spiroplasma sp. K1]
MWIERVRGDFNSAFGFGLMNERERERERERARILRDFTRGVTWTNIYREIEKWGVLWWISGLYFEEWES